MDFLLEEMVRGGTGVTFEIVSVLCGGRGVEGPINVRTLDNRSNALTPCQAYQELLVFSAVGPDVLIYVHDDVTLHDDQTVSRVLREFRDDNVVAVGLGGATSLGRPALYKEVYSIWNMARGGYASNQTDAQVHGERFTGVRQVAVLDAFFMAVRTSFLRDIGGWPVAHLSHHCLDLWLACEARRHKKEIWMVGASCTHHGGGSSTSPKYRDAAWLQGGSMEEDHARPHRWLYENYRDVLPFSV